MSFRSASNSNMVLNNLKINGTLTLANPSQEMSLTNLDVSENTVLNDLTVSGSTILNELSVTGNTVLNGLSVTGEFVLNELSVTGGSVLNELSVTGESILNTVQLNGSIVANSQAVTPEEVGFLSGATSNLQAQIDAIPEADMNSPTFTGLVTLPDTQTNGYMYFANDGLNEPTSYNSQYFEAIGSNMSGGNGEMDFVCSNANNSNPNLSAFDWLLATSSTTQDLLMRLFTDGTLFFILFFIFVTGNMVVSGLSTVNDVQLNGDITANSQTVTPEEVGFLSGASSNLQAQIDAIPEADMNNPTFTGLANLPTTQMNGYMYFSNAGNVEPINYDSQYFGAIGTNLTGGDGEMDFVNTNVSESNPNASAFD